MTASAEKLPVGIDACDCVTAFGPAAATAGALCAGQVALKPCPVLGRDGGDQVPLAMMGPMDETLPPRWRRLIGSIAAAIPGEDWGGRRHPVIVTSSNFGVGSLYAFMRDHDPRHLRHGTPWASVELVRQDLGWGPNIHVFSHACVTAHLGLTHAARLLHAGLAERVLVFSFDFLSPFVVGGFHSLKILNPAMPAPFMRREFGAIGLGDGVAFAVLSLQATSCRIEAQTLHNEMYHFTANQPDGSGFARGAAAMREAARGRRVWVKGHGTGTLEAGRLEVGAFADAFPAAPIVSWKGSLGHTLGSCGLVELAIAVAALRAGRIPGTVGSSSPCFSDTVALSPFSSAPFDAAILASNAFGGAHAALLLAHG